MKRSFALLLIAAAYACSSDNQDRAREINTSDTARNVPVAADTAMASMHHDSSSMRMSDSTMSGMNHTTPNHGHSATMSGHTMSQHTGGTGMADMRRGHDRMTMQGGMQHGMSSGDKTHAAHNMSTMQHDMTAMTHDSTRTMSHQDMRGMKHDTMSAVRHDTMSAMSHDTMRAMNHDTMARMRHDTMSMAHNMAAMPQMPGHGEMQGMQGMTDMFMTRAGPLTLMAMAQFFPTFTFALPRDSGTPLRETGFYVTQPAIMSNFSTSNERFVLRTTLNFEGLTQPGGELTFGGWGEGFIDKRHPHTLLHEFMLSWNNGNANRGFSVSAGKGFAPYGTDDPMSRPILKYPTNHHLSQALERWTVSGVLALGNWGLEAGVFGGQEPTGPYDLSNIESFGDSWSARATKRFGTGKMGTWPWEVSASAANIAENHDGATRHTRLYNVAIRHDHEHEGVPHYALAEYSRSSSDDDDPYFSVLGETSVRLGRHQPYARVEYADRPEYQREGPRGSDAFFRYDHDSDPIGATRWLIVTGGYGFTLGKNTKFSPRPYVEAQFNNVRQRRGQVSPMSLFGRSNFWSVSAGIRVFLGGEPMRMGTYGILDPMTAMHDMSGHEMSASEHDH